MSPLPASSNTKEWTESFSGHKLRWEIVGNLFTIFGLSVMTVADWDPLFATNKDGVEWSKRQSGENSRECAEACLALCNDIDSVNDFVIALMSAAYALQSFYEGDTSEPSPQNPFTCTTFIFSNFTNESQASNFGGDTEALLGIDSFE